MGDENLNDYYPSKRAIGELYRKIDFNDELSEPKWPRTHVDLRITTALRVRLSRFDIRPNAAQSDAVERLFGQYVYELGRICTLHSLDEILPLKEDEVVLGTIRRITSQPAKRKAMTARIKIHVHQLIEETELALAVGVGEKLEESLRFAWQAWIFSTGKTRLLSTDPPQDCFGYRSFGLVALQAIFRAIDALELGRLDTADAFQAPALLEELNLDFEA